MTPSFTVLSIPSLRSDAQPEMAEKSPGQTVNTSAHGAESGHAAPSRLIAIYAKSWDSTNTLGTNIRSPYLSNGL